VIWVLLDLLLYMRRVLIFMMAFLYMIINNYSMHSQLVLLLVTLIVLKFPANPFF